MYLAIEHSGTNTGLDAAEKIQQFAENEFGASCDQVVGSTEKSEVIVYNEDQEIVGIFGENPTEDTMRFTLAMAYDEEDN
jgi:hypothetical protein